MSYNGIGLQSVKGSSTSGHVQKNLSSTSSRVSKPGFHESRKLKINQDKLSNDLNNINNELKQNNEIKKELINHESLRKIEVKCMDLREKLEDEDVLNDDEIDFKVDELRKKLIKENEDVNDNKEKKTYEYKRLYNEKEKSRRA
ncbi:Pre-mRNA-splicing factor CWC21 [Candida tropicalis]